MVAENEIVVDANETSSALVVMPEPKVVVYEPMTAQEVVAHTERVHEIMKAVMDEGVHFGKIPGCGDKPALFKAGAEKLSLTFHLRPRYRIEESREGGHVRFTITTSLYGPSGEFMGEGLGEGSTAEDKYAWRKAVCAAEFDATPETHRRVKYFRNGSAQQIRTNPADVANTVLKMAKKRSLVDAVINACAASDILTQDIEDMAPELRGGTDFLEDTPPASSQPAAEAPKKQEPLISQDAIKRIRDLLDDTGEDIRPVLKKAGVDGLEMLTESQGNKTLAWLAKKKMEA